MQVEEVFNKLLKDGKNDATNIVNWMKETKVISQDKKEHEKVTQKLNSVADKGKITLDKFKQILNEIVAEKKLDLNALLGSVPAGAQNVMGTVAAALNKK